MRVLKNILSRIDKKKFKKYFFISLILLFIIIEISKVNITTAKYETVSNASIKPNFAFFITDISTTQESLKLDSITPREEPYLFTFSISNYKDNKKSNVDLRYTIEVISTTNLPLNFKLYKNTDLNIENKFTETITQNSDSVYYRHLVYNNESVMSYQEPITDIYTLWVEYPVNYKTNLTATHEELELIDVRIDAKEVVDV